MMDNDDLLFEEIKNFVIENYWDLRKGLNRETRVSEDLGIGGDDAAELLEKFGEKFEVDFSAFRFDEYFASEGLCLIRLILYLLRIKRYKALTLGDLEESVLLGKWVEPA